MKNLIRICILIIVAAVYSCDDPYKDETFAVYNMQPISSYLSTRPDDFSEWIKVMKYADMYNAVNQATAKLTLFAPTNRAMEAFYQEKKVSSVEELGKVYVRQLVQYHLVNDTITLEEFSKGGELEDKTLSNDILEVTFNADDASEGGFNSMYMNGEAHVKELAIHTSNGFVYVLDDVMRPMVESVYQKFFENNKNNILAEALKRTGWHDTLNIIADTITMPALQFNRLFIFGKEYNINEFLHEDKQKHKVLELDHSQNFFGLSFIVIDYLNGSNYTYYYTIEGLSDNWIENGTSTTTMFSNLAPGQYTLWVKYRSNITGKESAPQPLTIRITPPWYMTSLAYWCYSILFIGFIAWCIHLSVKRYRRKRDAMIERINRRQRNELYESKLRFFTNVTHEFCTPLTLIYGPCQRILTYPSTDNYIRKYASIIQQNAQKLNALILELIEFRRLETGNKTLEIQKLPVSAQTQNTADSFNELAESRKINYQLKIEKEVYWNSDAGCFSKIINNLLSNAFKYTPENGMISIEQYVENEQLHIRISNTGKGIEKENLTKIFDRYKILDNFEIQNKNGISPRNGLGLAICHSMVTLLNGQIRVTSTPNQLTTFEVILPALSITATDTERPMSMEMETVIQEGNETMELESPTPAYDTSRQTIIVIDDDPSMLWFVSDIFANKYNVFSFNDTEKAMEQLKLRPVDLIISDIMMPGTDGISFAKQIKSDKLLTHTPLILLSALNSIDNQMKGIDSGAEAYVTKPFNTDYLIKLAERLIQREKDLKEYYNSVFCTFKLDDGQFLHKEDKVFFEKMMKIIDQNITNPELSVELLSSSLGYSTRHFYRKLKEITEQTPADIIKEYRLAIAEQLLLSTNLTVEEIMDKSGFMNRGTFYKIFSQKHNMPPRQYRERQKKDFKKACSPQCSSSHREGEAPQTVSEEN